MKWILSYVKGLINRYLAFDRNKAAIWDIVGFIDSDYAGDLDRRRSILGDIFTMHTGAIHGKHHFSPLQLFLLWRLSMFLLLLKEAT